VQAKFLRFFEKRVLGKNVSKAKAKPPSLLSLLGLMLLTVSPTPLPSHSQSVHATVPSAEDLRLILSKMDKTSDLHLIYQDYRANRDGLQKGAERISLAEALAQGVSSSPLLASVVADLQASEWTGVAIQREWVPSLSLKTSTPGVLGYSTTSTTETTKQEGRSASQQVSFKNGVQSNPYADLSWSFFDATRSARLSAREARSLALRNRLTFTTRELVLAIQTSYTTLQAALARENDLIDLFNQAVGIYIHASKLHRLAGEMSRLEAQVVSLLVARIRAHKESIQAANALANLINLEPGTLALPSEPATLIPNWSLSREASIQRALDQREELRANALDVQALMREARAIRLKALPALALSGQLQRTSVNQVVGRFDDNQVNVRTRSSGTTTFVGLTFDWKLLDGGIRDAEANSGEAKAQQTLAQGKLIRLRIGREVADAYAAFVASKIQVDAARADVDASRRSLQGAIAHSASGPDVDAATTLVQALTKLQTALDTYRTLVADQNVAIQQLYRATSSWPDQTEGLVRAHYQRWLPAVPGSSAAPAPAAATP
jgi:outer membrane protein TolC